MKKYGMLLAVVFLVSVCFNQTANAQVKTKEEKEKEKELRLQESIDVQKKAMIEQQKAEQIAREEVERAMIIQKEAVDRAMDKVNEKIGKIDDPEHIERTIKIYQDMGRNRSFPTGEPFNWVTPNMDAFFHNTNGDNERTTWDFSKSIKESSFSRDYIFDVEPSAKSVVMSVSGDCKAGEIRIKIIMPGGKLFSEIIIDEFGNLNWRKSLTISETENKDKTGAWKFEIKSSKATGYFKIFFQAS